MTVLSENATKGLAKPKRWLGVRHLQIALLFTVIIIGFATRSNLNIALLAMTDPNNEYYFDIDLKIQSILQSSLFWGYQIALVPAGELITRYGAKRFLMLHAIVNALLSFALPFSRFIGPEGWKLILVCRVAQGLFQGFLIPSSLTIISKWVPEEERSRLGSLTYSGIQIGNAFQMLTSGFLADAWGWPAIFYFYGILGLSWSILYAFLGDESPSQSKLISEEEKNYIQSSSGFSGVHKRLKTPWRALFTSMPYISSIVAYCAFKWGFYTLLTQIPTYMKQMQGLNIRQNGVVTAMPYLALFILAYPCGYIADVAIERKYLSITTTRKIFTALGLMCPAVCLFALSQASPDSTVAAVAFLTLTVAGSAGCYPGFMLSHLDMAPNYPASMMAVCNVFANVMSIIAPIAAGFILDDGTELVKWQTVFYISVGINTLATLFYLIFADCNVQPWNDPEYKKKKTEE